MKSITVYGSTWRYMAWICAGGRGSLAYFWCAFESAALPAPSVAAASSHCMHKLVYSSFCSPFPAYSPVMGRPFDATRGRQGSRRRRRGSRLVRRRWDRGRGHIPRADPGPTGALGQRRGGGGRRGGVGGGRRGASTAGESTAGLPRKLCLMIWVTGRLAAPGTLRMPS